MDLCKVVICWNDNPGFTLNGLKNYCCCFRSVGIKSCFYAMAKDERFILERQYGYPTTPIRTVAERANVSIATVSRTINHVPTVNAKMAKRVWEAIRELLGDGPTPKLTDDGSALVVITTRGAMLRAD